MTLKIGRFAEIGTVRGAPLQVGERRLIPLARIMTVTLGRRGWPVAFGFTWTRPVAVEVTEPWGTRRIRIAGSGRGAMWGLVAAILLLGLSSLPGGGRAAGRRGHSAETGD